MLSPPTNETQQGTPALQVSQITFTQALTESEVAFILQVSERTLQKWRYEGRGPSFYREGKVIRYPSQALQTYIESKVVNHDH